MSTETVDDLIKQLKDIRIQENEVLERLYRARQRETGNHGEQSDGEQSGGFKKGDRVTITNKIRTPFGRRANTGDRNSTVLYVNTDNNTTVDNIRIHIRTDNGSTTWRLRKNLRRLPQPEAR